jgi:hypothetical protein
MIARTPNHGESFRSVAGGDKENSHRGHSRNARESHSPNFNLTVNAPLQEVTNHRKISYKKQQELVNRLMNDKRPSLLPTDCAYSSKVSRQSLGSA